MTPFSFLPPSPGNAARPVIAALEPSRIPAADLIAAADAGEWRTLPGGFPLILTAAGMEFLLDDFSGHDYESLRSAHRVLYFATRTGDQLAALWEPQPRMGGDADDDTPDTPREPMALRVRALQATISRWASETFEVGAEDAVRYIASRLWAHCVERLPISAEKKSPDPAVNPPDSGNHGSATSAGSPEAPPSPDSSTPFSTPPPSTPSPPSSVGPTPTESP